MAETKANSIPTFEYGDTFSIMLRVSDSSGVSRAEIRFRDESGESVKSIYRSVELHGEPESEAVFEFQVDENMPPGDYVCEYVALTDQKGNQSLLTAPGIEFRVEGDFEEHRGPVLLDWSIA